MQTPALEPPPRTRRRTRLNPLRTLTAQTLTAAMESFDAGDLRQAAYLWDAMAARDDVLSNVKAKREKACAHRKWQIVTDEKSPAAERQKEVLEDFWRSVRAYDWYDRNRRGGLGFLLRHLSTAVSYRYAAAHLIWRPDGATRSLRLTAETVPLWFFENRTGELRFDKTASNIDGEALAPGDWITHTGDGLMMAGGICYFAKRLALSDWLTFSERFGIPSRVGRTTHGQNTPGGEAMAAAVAALSNDAAAVIYGDDGNGKIELIETKGGASSLPFPPFIDRVDRRIAALYRGADLSSISADSGGDSTGASLQEREADIVDTDDAVALSETLQEIEERVLWHHFGRSQRLARIELVTPQREDTKLLLDVVTELADRGAPIAVASTMARFGLTMPEEGEQLLAGLSHDGGRDADNGVEPSPKGHGGGSLPPHQLNDARLSGEEAFIERAETMIAEADQARRADIRAELAEVLAMPDGSGKVEALRKVAEDLPKKIGGNDSEVVATWERFLSAALVGGLDA